MTEEQKDFQLAVRVAVAEARLDSHAQMIENNQELTAKIVDRMDIHIREQGHRDVEITKVIDDCRIAISEWKTSAETFVATVRSFMKVGVAILSGFAVIVSGIWAVYVFYMGYQNTAPEPAKTQIEQKK